MRSENKARDIFYGVVAIATLIVAIVGATLAYFSVTASSNEGAVNATAAIVSIEYNDGQQVTAQADQLIPATLDVVQQVYEETINQLTDEDADTTLNACLDSNNKQVCSAYRFTIRSDIERTITATLNNEYNGFAYLSYAVYDVTNNKWLTLDDDNNLSLPLTSCSNENNEGENANTTDDCYTMSGTIKTYTNNNEITATNSIFGYKLENAISTFRSQTIASATQAYDLVLFIKETHLNQNVDQGKSYSGTIVVDVLEGGANNGQITGCVGPDCGQ